MPELNTRVDAALAGDGPLAAVWPGWRVQPAQRRMAQAVADTLQQGGALLAPLPTGGGKTLAYLVPLLLSGHRAVVATSTHVLQHQLAGNDLPRLAQALNRPAQVAVLKGRGRYVCLQRLREVVQRGPRPGELPRHARLRELLAWAQASRDGDFDEQPRLASDPALRATITSTSESCLRQVCPSWADCHVERARRRADGADVVVINHHVWLGELRAQRQGRTAGVPRCDTLVFDEAHALHELARHWHTARADATSVARFWADLAELAQGPMRGAAPWTGLALQGGRALRSMSMALHGAAPREGLQAWPLPDALPVRELGIALQWAHRALEAAQGGDARLAVLRERAVAIAGVLQGVLAPEGDEPAWLEWRDNQRWSMVRPGPQASEAAAHELATGAAWGARSVIHTSATLGDEPGLRWHGDALGLPPSAVDWRTLPLEPGPVVPGAVWHVPPDLPEPADPAHGEALARRVAHWAGLLGGQVLVLATTRRAADRLAAALLAELPPRWRVLRASGENGRQGWQALRDEAPTVVVASGAFWRGVDVPGNRLRLVVVDKLPFAPPDDPWLQRRLTRARAAGLNAFDAVQVADAAMALRQAAGRLIRGPADQGLFVVGDVRLRQRAYASRLRAALANWRWLEDEASVAGWLGAMALTRASTTGHSCA
ncbi:MAG: ATP-dependent DNA helicase [Hydrogenophaga sp.]|nr:ATP-dependent DNA helicase [Hydrogenophaga sp.]